MSNFTKNFHYQFMIYVKELIYNLVCINMGCKAELANNVGDIVKLSKSSLFKGLVIDTV
jgi:hypothetical protein